MDWTRPLQTSVIAAALVTSGVALAQNGPIDIDFGSGRIGGPGVTRSERKAIARSYEPDEYPTEDNIPPQGHKNRIPHLHILAKQYASGTMWKNACDKYDVIVSEGGDEGLVAGKEGPGGKKLAARSYLQCAKSEAIASNYNKAERLLKKSEKFGVSDYRHAAVRRGMVKEQYHKKLSKGDIDGAMVLYDKYQAERKDEDERIWFGEQLADLADRAYKEKDKVAMKRYIGYATKIAPQNTKLRKLVDTIETEETIVQKALVAGVALVLFVVMVTAFGRWRGRKKIEALAGGGSSFGKKNKFIDDDDF